MEAPGHALGRVLGDERDAAGSRITGQEGEDGRTTVVDGETGETYHARVVPQLDPFLRRAVAAIERAGEKRRGKGLIFAPHITAAPHELPEILCAVIEAGATAVIQPGGSMRDQEVIDAADKAGVAMVFTGIRHF